MDQMVMILEIRSDYIKVIDGQKNIFEYNKDMSSVINILDLEVGEVIEKKELENFIAKTQA